MKMVLVKKQGVLGALADTCMRPLMYIAAGTVWEKPQQTHWWNNVRLEKVDVEDLLKSKMIHCDGVPWAMSRVPILTHIPILGGWRNYVALRIDEEDDMYWSGLMWHIGWITKDMIGISRVPIVGSVRVLIGRDDVFFFAMGYHPSDEEDPVFQLRLQELGPGVIGQGGPWAHIKLL